MMANCELEIDVRAAVWPVRLNQTIAEVIQRNVEAVGMPDWTEEEHAFARALQKGAGVPEDRPCPQTTPLTGPASPDRGVQRLRRRLVEGADGPPLVSRQRTALAVSSLERGRGSRHLDRAQGRCRRQRRRLQWR